MRFLSSKRCVTTPTMTTIAWNVYNTDRRDP